MTEKECTVHPYDSKEYDPIVLPVATCLTLYEHPSGEKYILQVSEALWREDLDQSLLATNQLRDNGLVVNDVLRQFPRDEGDVEGRPMSIIVPGGDGEEPVVLPLETRGTMPYLPVRKPMEGEVEELPWLELTSETDWDPYSVDFSRIEEDLAKDDRHREDSEKRSRRAGSVRSNRQINAMKASYLRNSEASAVLRDVSNTLVARDFVDALGDTVQVHLPSSDGDGVEVEIKSAESKPRREYDYNDIVKKFGVGIQTAKDTAKATTRRNVRNVVYPLNRRYRTKHSMMKYNQLSGTFYTDTLEAKTSSVWGHKYGQIFCNDRGFAYFVPMKAKSEAGDALEIFAQDVGVPSHFHMDNAKEQKHSKFGKLCKRWGTKLTTTEPGSPWQNRAESCIRELKKDHRRVMRRTNAPYRLWNFGMKHRAEIRSRTALPLFKLDGRTPVEVITGNTPDIAEWLTFDWYEPVWYGDDDAWPTKGHGDKIGRVLGVAHRVGQEMCYWILPESGIPIARTTVHSISESELADPNNKRKLEEFDARIRNRLGEPDFEVDPGDDEHRIDVLDDFEPFDTDAAMPEADDFTPEEYDQYISARVMLPHLGENAIAEVKRRKRDLDGNPIGQRHANPLLDTRTYEIQFEDGSTEEVTANLIAESLWSQCDAEGNEELLMDEIVDHRRDGSAVSMENGTFTTSSGNERKKITTAGWHITVSWKNGETSEVPLKDIKEAYPIQLAEYAVANKIDMEPAFAWWVPQILRRRNRIISKAKTRYWKRTHKFGIELPKSVEEALAIDRRTGTDYWAKAIEKEMKAVGIAFDFKDEGASKPVGFTEIKCHLVFDIKMDFTRKARFVAGGHMTEAPSTITYASVVSRESVRILFMLAALNDLNVLSADISNAYLNAPCAEKVCFKAGHEFGDRKGRWVVITRSLYGLRTAGYSFRSHLKASLLAMGFKPCLADPDVYLQPSARDDGTPYYEYVCCFVDDALAFSVEPAKIMEALGKTYKLKPVEGSNVPWEEPKRYLGADVGKYNLSGETAWYMSSDSYVKLAVQTVEDKLRKHDLQLSKKAEGPIQPTYRPELDVSALLDDEQANFYQELVGVLNWIVELGRIDIHTSVSKMSAYLAAPRKGHLMQVLHVFAYLKKYNRSKTVLNPEYIDHDARKRRFEEADWSDQYPDAQEELPPGMPEPRGNEAQLNVYCDADHAGDKVTRRSHSGIVIFANSAPIYWYSKRQNTVEASTFGSEFICLRIASEKIRALRYKLRMMGVPIDGPANVFVDNESVVKSATRPEGQLKKKHLSICYHAVRECIASGMMRVGWVKSESNLADVLTKIMSGAKIRGIVGRFLY